MAIKYTVTVHELFKYTMNLVYTRVNQEWKDLSVTYPQWVSTLVLDELYYILTMTLVCATSFAMGAIIGTVVAVV